MAKTWQEELETIRQHHGGVLKPAEVVQFARNPKTALHAKFVWDNDAAAEAYRIYQARQLIRVTVSMIPSTETNARVFVSLRSDRKNNEGGGYRAVVDVLSDEEQQAEMLADALAELNVFRRKYSRLRQLAAIFAAIDEMTTAKA